MRVQEEDTLQWKEDWKGSFNVKLYYNFLCSKTTSIPNQRNLGVSSSPQNVFFFFGLGCIMEEDLVEYNVYIVYSLSFFNIGYMYGS